MESLLRGDEGAHRDFAALYVPRVRGACLKQIGFSHSIDDLVQETLTRGLAGLQQLKERHQLGAWLSSIARRVCIDHIRLKVKEKEHLPDLTLHTRRAGSMEFAVAEAGGETGEGERLESLKAQINGLPEELREVLVLKYYRDMNYEQMALELSMSVATVNARLTQARKLLRDRMTRESLHDA